MKKLIEIAAGYNYYTRETLPAEIKNNPYFIERGARLDTYDRGTLPNGLQSLPGIEAEKFFEVRKEVTNAGELIYYVEYNYVILARLTASDTVYQLREYRGKYSFFPLYKVINELQKNSSYDQRRRYLDGLTEPNKIGVFTSRKVAAWFTYCDQYITALQTAYDAIETEKTAARARFTMLVDQFKQAGATGYFYADRAYITAGDFKIDLELQNNGTYLSEKTEYRGTPEKILNIWRNIKD